MPRAASVSCREMSDRIRAAGRRARQLSSGRRGVRALPPPCPEKPCRPIDANAKHSQIVEARQGKSATMRHDTTAVLTTERQSDPHGVWIKTFALSPAALRSERFDRTTRTVPYRANEPDRPAARHESPHHLEFTPMAAQIWSAELTNRRAWLPPKSTGLRWPKAK